MKNDEKWPRPRRNTRRPDEVVRGGRTLPESELASWARLAEGIEENYRDFITELRKRCA